MKNLIWKEKLTKLREIKINNEVNKMWVDTMPKIKINNDVEQTNNFVQTSELVTVPELAELIETTKSNIYQSLHEGYLCKGYDLSRAKTKQGGRLYFDLDILGLNSDGTDQIVEYLDDDLNVYIAGVDYDVDNVFKEVNLEDTSIVVYDSITKFVENSELDNFIYELRKKIDQPIYVYTLSTVINKQGKIKLENINDNTENNKRQSKSRIKNFFYKIFG